ncbi:chemotaxis protein CheZ [Pseudoroseomonas deserti]|uniref:Chemotaxis protein CheZ n=1 Tax=Teichococcus deserti TaxID=1817963 RepID=A0A1V2GU41_9PROT|nr:protein phosphatase CheZ [Pseudoroseomonas deserti]ONG44714.1 chemotaxis protein CheZ [Pseudoroseomonas deserti]
MSTPTSLRSGLARIAGQAAAIAGEVDRLMGLQQAADQAGAEPAEEADRLAQAMEEMRGMSKLLAETRAEVIGLSPPPMGLGDTLDAVVGETEGAAFEILRQAERAQAAAGRLHAGTSTDTGADLTEVDEAATAIVLACAFQDITGQRVRKVLSTMRAVEARVAALVALMGISPEETQAPGPAAEAKKPDAHLLNGPSSAAQGGLGQSAVDDLFG